MTAPVLRPRRRGAPAVALALVWGVATVLWTQRMPWGWASALAAGIALILVGSLAVQALARCLVVVTVQGLSMLPTYRPGDRVLVWRGRIPGRGRVVVVERTAPERTVWDTEPAGLGCGSADLSSRRWLIKRVVGLPGDPVRRGEQTPADLADDRVPAGNLLLLGDNAKVSLDSRRIGFFPEDRVLGAVLFRL